MLRFVLQQMQKEQGGRPIERRQRAPISREDGASRTVRDRSFDLTGPTVATTVPRKRRAERAHRDGNVHQDKEPRHDEPSLSNDSRPIERFLRERTHFYVCRMCANAFPRLWGNVQMQI